MRKPTQHTSGVAHGFANLRLLGAAAVSLCCLGHALASPACQPTVSLPIEAQSDGLLSVGARINEHPVHAIIDTGGSFGMVPADTARSLGLKVESKARKFGFLFGGVRVREIARGELVLGSQPATSIELAVVPPGAIGDEADLLLGADFLQAFDVDIDFEDGKLMLFPKDACGLQASRATGAEPVDMLQDAGGHILIPVVLDGRKLIAVVDTGAPRTAMKLGLAKELFGLSEPAAKELERVSINGGNSGIAFVHSFASLEVARHLVLKPEIRIVSETTRSRTAPQLFLGLDMLRYFHVYISNSERKLYLAPLADH